MTKTKEEEKARLRLYLGSLTKGGALALLMGLDHPTRMLSELEWAAYRKNTKYNQQGKRKARVVRLSQLKTYLQELRAVPSIALHIEPEVLDWINAAKARKNAAQTPPKPPVRLPGVAKNPEALKSAVKRPVTSHVPRKSLGQAEDRDIFDLHWLVSAKGLGEEDHVEGLGIVLHYQENDEKLSQDQWFAVKKLVSSVKGGK